MAKKFKFRLQSVLDLKIKNEDDEKRRFADVMQLQTREEQIMAALQQKQVALTAELKRMQGVGAIDITKIQICARAIERTKQEIVNQQLRLQEVAIMVDQQRKKLIEATQEKKIYEKAKENKHKAYLEEVEFAEKLLIDELATLKFARKKEE